MIHYGNLRKMTSELHEEVHYEIPLYDKTSFSESVSLNQLIG